MQRARIAATRPIVRGVDVDGVTARPMILKVVDADGVVLA